VQCEKIIFACNITFCVNFISSIVYYRLSLLDISFIFFCTRSSMRLINILVRARHSVLLTIYSLILFSLLRSLFVFLSFHYLSGFIFLFRLHDVFFVGMWKANLILVFFCFLCVVARKQEILKLTEQLLEAISAGDYDTYA